MRRMSVTLIACLTLAACGDSEESAPPETDSGTASRYAAAQPAEETVVDGVYGEAAPATGGAVAGFDGRFAADKQLQRGQSGESYIYDHNLAISMASEFIKARFERARDKCENDIALKCKIMSASFRLIGEPDAALPVANLTVAMPHESVEIYEDSLLQPLPNENKDDVVVKSRNTSAQNVTNQVKDIESRLAQLTNYRDRMMELSKRGGAKTDDLIKIEGEISRTQAEIEQIEAQRRDLAERIAKENISISFEAESTVSDAFQPVRDVWQNSLRVMGQSFALVLGLIVGIIPWIPVFLIGFFGLRWLLRRLRRSS